jgi:HicB family
MGRLTLRLPETLHQQLGNLAEREGVSLKQYIVYALTRQVSPSYSVQRLSEEDVEQQQRSFNELKQRLGQSSPAQIAEILAERERVEPEAELNPKDVERLKQLIRDCAQP